MPNFNEISRLLWPIKRSDSWIDATYVFLLICKNNEFQAELILHEIPTATYQRNCYCCVKN